MSYQGKEGASYLPVLVEKEGMDDSASEWAAADCVSDALATLRHPPPPPAPKRNDRVRMRGWIVRM